MRRLNQNGIDINRLAPGLFDDSGESAFTQKQGAPLDWYIPDFTGGKKKMPTPPIPNQRGGNTRGNNFYPTAENRKIVMSNQKIPLTCHMNSITMGELGEIGWYLKLELA